MRTRNDYETIFAIVKRAESTGIFANFDRLTLTMDIDKALAQFNIQPADFLALDDSTFLHDFAGIVGNMDRHTGRVVNCFLPRATSF